MLGRYPVFDLGKYRWVNLSASLLIQVPLPYILRIWNRFMLLKEAHLGILPRVCPVRMTHGRQVGILLALAVAASCHFHLFRHILGLLGFEQSGNLELLF